MKVEPADQTSAGLDAMARAMETIGDSQLTIAEGLAHLSEQLAGLRGSMATQQVAIKEAVAERVEAARERKRLAFAEANQVRESIHGRAPERD